MNRLERESIDAALHLLDRQVDDVDGEMVCNVDDLEITDRGDGALVVTGLLAGGAALFPRFYGPIGQWLRTTWNRLGPEQADRDVPYRIPLELIDRLDSAVCLTARRDGLLVKQEPAEAGVVLRRMSELLALRVLGEGGELGDVLDVRIDPRGPGYVVRQLLVGRGRPGSLLGYDRGGAQGPWLVNALVKRLHRHTGEVPWERARSIDWEAGVVHIRGGLDPLTDS